MHVILDNFFFKTYHLVRNFFFFLVQLKSGIKQIFFFKYLYILIMISRMGVLF